MPTPTPTPTQIPPEQAIVEFVSWYNSYDVDRCVDSYSVKISNARETCENFLKYAKENNVKIVEYEILNVQKTESQAIVKVYWVYYFGTYKKPEQTSYCSLTFENGKWRFEEVYCRPE